MAAFESHRRFIKVAIEAEHLKVTPSTTSQDLQVAIREIVKAGVQEKVVAGAYADVLPMVIAGAIRASVLRRIAEDAPLVTDAEAIVSIVLDGARA
jgi:hypothetical protein